MFVVIALGHKLIGKGVMGKKLVFSILLIAGIAISGCGNDAEKAKQAITDSLERASDEAWCDALSDAGNWDLYEAEDC